MLLVVDKSLPPLRLVQRETRVEVGADTEKKKSSLAKQPGPHPTASSVEEFEACDALGVTRARESAVSAQFLTD